MYLLPPSGVWVCCSVVEEMNFIYILWASVICGRKLIPHFLTSARPNERSVLLSFLCNSLLAVTEMDNTMALCISGGTVIVSVQGVVLCGQHYSC